MYEGVNKGQHLSDWLLELLLSLEDYCGTEWNQNKLFSFASQKIVKVENLLQNAPYKIDYQSYKVHPTHPMSIPSSHQSPLSSTSSVGQHRDYEWLKNQFDGAMKELQVYDI